MTTSILERDGKAYLVEDGRIVKAANDPTQLLPDLPERVAIGARVEADGKLGVVISRVEGMLGEHFGIRFDNGDTEAFYAEDIKLSAVEPPQFDSAVDAVLADSTTYEAMSGDTLEQVEEKLATARSLNLRAKALASDSKTPLADRMRLDHVVASTGLDLSDLVTTRDELRLAAAQGYLDELPKYEVSNEVHGHSEASERDDVSWLSVEADLAAEDLAGVDWTKEFEFEANDLAETMDPEWINDDEVIMARIEARYHVMAGGLPTDDTRKQAFVKRAQVAIIRKRAELQERAEEPEVEVSDVDEVSDEALWL